MYAFKIKVLHDLQVKSNTYKLILQRGQNTQRSKYPVKTNCVHSMEWWISITYGINSVDSINAFTCIPNF